MYCGHNKDSCIFLRNFHYVIFPMKFTCFEVCNICNICAYLTSRYPPLSSYLMLKKHFHRLSYHSNFYPVSHFMSFFSLQICSFENQNYRYLQQPGLNQANGRSQECLGQCLLLFPGNKQGAGSQVEPLGHKQATICDRCHWWQLYLQRHNAGSMIAFIFMLRYCNLM